MKKNLLLLFYLLLSYCFAHAQYVNIPDMHFREFLKNKYPSCLNASDQLDTTCSNIINETSLYINYGNVVDLEGIQYFKSLQMLNCQMNGITNIPSLPASLLGLYCQYNQLESLPALPANLRTLECYRNNLTELPPLNNNLESLSCYNNDIYCFPILPHGLLHVFFDSSKIHCAPNAISGIFADFTTSSNFFSLPVCNGNNNLNNCPVPPFLVSGKAFYDNNKNGIRDNAEPYRTDFKLTLSGNSAQYADNTDLAGLYQFTPPAAGSYTLDISDTLAPLYEAIPASSVIDLTGANASVVQDIILQSTLTNPANLSITGYGTFTLSYSYDNPGNWPPIFTFHGYGSIVIEYRNDGTTIVSPVITLNYDPALLTYTEATNPAVINNGNQIVLTETDLLPGEHRSFTAYFLIPESAQMQIEPFTTIASIITEDGTGSTVAFQNQVIGLLPLELTSFRAEAIPGNTARLYWNTANEINTASFTVEQSINGRNFTSISTVPAKNKNSNQYSFNSKMPDAAWVYYRLKINDVDNRSTYSNTIKLKGTVSKGSFTILNNPARNILSINTDARQLYNSMAQIINSQGAVVKKIRLLQGTQTIDISGFSAGCYFINTNMGSKKIIIIR